MAALLRRAGGGRTTVYFVRDPLIYLERAVEPGREIGCNMAWLHNFKPNHDSFFSSGMRQEMWQAGRVAGMQPSLFYQRVFERFLIGMSWASSKMEGNTYSLLDTEKLILEGLEAKGKSSVETVMILNHKSALLHMIENLDSIGISVRKSGLPASRSVRYTSLRFESGCASSGSARALTLRSRAM